MNTLFFLLLVLFGMHQPKEITLVDFSKKDNTQDWYIINDGVMGGLSQSKIQLNEAGNAVFSGTLSLENNGGFASTRTRFSSSALKGHQVLSLRVKGDGRTYKFRIRTNQNFDGVAYSADFATKKDQWMQIDIPFADFKPTFRGRVLTNAPALDLDEMEQIGFLLGDKKAGEFRLEIAWIKSIE